MQISKKNTRIKWIDTAKGVGIILVVYGHVLVGLNSSPLDLSENFFRSSFDFIWSFHMHLFFFLAGILAVKSLKARHRFEFLHHKVKMIMYPYFLWSFVQGVIQVIMNKYTNSSLEFVDILKIVYKPLPCQHFWFLYVLFLFFLVVTLLYTNKLSFVILFLISIILFFYPLNTSVRVFQKIQKFFLFFMIGILYSKYNIEFFLQYIKSKINLVVILIILLLHFWLFFEVFLNFKLTAFIFFLNIFGVFNVIMLSCFLEKRTSFGFLNFIGKYSLQIYLLHSFFLGSSRIFLYNFLHVKNILTHIIIGLIFGILFPLVISYSSRQNKFKYLFTLN